jgi:hypothetical protein
MTSSLRARHGQTEGLASRRRSARLWLLDGEERGSVTTFALFALAALVASVLVGGLLRRIWTQHEQRTIDRKWQERERALDRRRPVAPRHEIRERRSRPAGMRDVAKAATVARVLYIVARYQPELFAFLRQDFAAEEAEREIEILMDRRQGPWWEGMQPREANRRDPRRNWGVRVDLREMGFALVRQQTRAPDLPSLASSGRDGAASGYDLTWDSQMRSAR